MIVFDQLLSAVEVEMLGWLCWPVAKTPKVSYRELPVGSIIFDSLLLALEVEVLGWLCWPTA